MPARSQARPKRRRRRVSQGGFVAPLAARVRLMVGECRAVAAHLGDLALPALAEAAVPGPVPAPPALVEAAVLAEAVVLGRVPAPLALAEAAVLAEAGVRPSADVY